jgi:hypothetical protein
MPGSFAMMHVSGPKKGELQGILLKEKDQRDSELIVVEYQSEKDNTKQSRTAVPPIQSAPTSMKEGVQVTHCPVCQEWCQPEEPVKKHGRAEKFQSTGGDTL